MITVREAASTWFDRMDALKRRRRPVTACPTIAFGLKRMLVELRETLKQTLPPKLVHAYQLVRHTMWWPTESEMVAARQFLARDKIAVDVGANVGLFTAVLARRSKCVIAFEANLACAKNSPGLRRAIAR